MDSKRSHIFVLTHHKSGTVWMMTTFIRLAKANGFRFVQLNEGESGWDVRSQDQADVFFESKRKEAEGDSDQPVIFHKYHGIFPNLELCKADRGAKGIQIVRDPRDMLLSSVRFHLVSDEAWLHEGRADLGGKTFQEKLASLSSLEDQVRFEMDTHMGWTIEQMSNLDDQGAFVNIRYEDLIVDAEMKLFSKILVDLGLRDPEVAKGTEAFWESSVFGERSEHDMQITRSHIFNSNPEQWMRAPRDVISLIEGRFGHEIEQLGYPLV
jgi:Sulfotransferase domain